MPPTQSNCVIKITDDILVCCPPDDRLMTPYVLREQNDWFEDEIRFIRGLVAPDSKFIDIGANYGLYSLSVAKHCPSGHVWSYEPGDVTATYLRESVEANGFANLTLSGKALSDKVGQGRLLANENSELNALIEADSPGSMDGRAISVELTTLDAECAGHAWQDIDLVKIDAEGHEARVIDGGREFFSSQSPLIMCEIKAGAKIDLAPVERLRAFGYDSYRLMPALQALAPQDPAQGIDGYQLNIFCCKPDRAAVLASRGVLVMAGASSDQTPAPAAWQDLMRSSASGRVMLDAWQRLAQGRLPVHWPEHEAALNVYALSRAPGADIETRYQALSAAYRLLDHLVHGHATLPRMLSFVRVATDLGAREIAVKALTSLINSFNTRARRDDPWDEPFLPASPDFDQIAPRASLRDWGLASALDAYETLRAHSSYFSRPDLTVDIAADLERMGYRTPRMARRAQAAQTLRN